MFKKSCIIFFIIYIFFFCTKEEKGALLDTGIFSEKENISYIVQTIKGDSVGVINFSINKEGNFLNFVQDFPYSEVKMDLKTLKPVSSLFRIVLPGRGPVEIRTEFKGNQIKMKAITPAGERDTTISVKDNFYHSDFIFMLPRALPFVDGKTYEIKSFVPMRAQIFTVKINFIGKGEFEVKGKKIKGYHVTFDYDTEKHDAYYEENAPHRLLFYSNGKYNLIAKL